MNSDRQPGNLAPEIKPGGTSPSRSVAVDADRWLEVDLYWFDRDDVAGSVGTFWRRFAPLFRAVTGWRGIIVNVGWLMDYVLDWRGSLADRIPIPQNLNKDKFFKASGPLAGDTAERMRKWEERFAAPTAHTETYYQDWTYGNLKELAEGLRRTAADEFDLEGVKVGSFVLGWESIYGGNASAWARRHPSAFFGGVWWEPVFNVEARLDADGTRYGAFPDGIEGGTPIHEFFGAQWGDLSKEAGLDAIVLRDSVIGQGIYRRVGPYGDAAPPDPAKVASWSQATAALVRATKRGNDDSADMSRRLALSIPPAWTSSRRLAAYDVWNRETTGEAGKTLEIHLKQAQCRLLALG